MQNLKILITLSLLLASANALALDITGNVEVAADQLELRQKQGRAVFKTNVRVVHGPLKITTDVLEVYYKGGVNEGLDGDIQRLVASGNVYAMLPKGETITAESAVYDPQNKQLNLEGNVALVRGDNVLSGNKLSYNLGTGVASLKASGGDGRVKAKLAPTSK